MTDEDILLEDGEPYPPRVRGTVDKFIEEREESSYTDGRGDIPVNVEYDIDWVVYYRWCQWIKGKLDGVDWEFVRNGEHSDRFEEIVRDYISSNSDLMDRFKEMAYWCKDGAMLVNIKKAEEQGGIEKLIDEKGVRKLAEQVYEGKQEVDTSGGPSEGNGSDGSDGQSSFGESRFPKLYELGIVDDDGRVVESKFRGLLVAFLKDVDEIRGEKEEPNKEAVKWAFLNWGQDKFEREWIDLITKYIDKDPLGHTANYVVDNKEEMVELIKEKYKGNQDVSVGNPGTDDLCRAFLDSEVPGWDEQDDEQDEDDDLDHWERYEKESKKEKDEQAYESDSGDNQNDGDSTDQKEEQDGVRDDSPGTLGEWADEQGTTTQDEFRPSKSKQEKVHGGSSTSRNKVREGKQENASNAAERGGQTRGSRPYPIEWPVVDRKDELEKDKVYEGNTFEWAMKLPENSVDTIVTSPPYYALRDYEVDDRVPISGDWTCDHEFEDNFCIECGAFYGQLGREPNPSLFIDHIVDLMERYRLVLKPTGSLWLNIGDTYAGEDVEGRANVRNKSRMMVPERVYRRMVESGWVLRDYVIWAKKVWMPNDKPRGNGKPFSSSSRLADQWEPMVRFTPESDSYTDVDSNRLMPPSFDGDMGQAAQDSKFRDGEDTRRGKTYNAMGTNPPDVWLVNSDGYQGDHRAVFPEELARRCIKLSTPDRVCERCGKPYQKEVQVENENTVTPGGDHATYKQQCRCGTGHEPGVAFDPFLGSGTTGLAAAEEGLHWAGTELSPKYAELARDRIPNTRATGLDQWT